MCDDSNLLKSSINLISIGNENYEKFKCQDERTPLTRIIVNKIRTIPISDALYWDTIFLFIKIRPFLNI